MSRTFSSSSGSCDSRNDSVRCGLSPNARHKRPIDVWLRPGGLRHRPGAPVGTPARRRLERASDDGFYLIVADLARCARARLIVQTIEPILAEPCPPQMDGRTRAAERGGDPYVGFASSGPENDPCSEGNVPRTSSSRSEPFERVALVIGQVERSTLAAWHAALRSHADLIAQKSLVRGTNTT